MTDKEKIRNEVERLMAEFIQEKGKGYSSNVDDACILELQNVLTYIDSLQEEPMSENLDEAAKKAGQKYFPNENNIWARPNYEAKKAEYAFKEGVEWQEKQCQKTIELAEDHAYLAGQEKMIDKACEWLADNYSKYIITNGLATIFSATIDFDTIRMIEDFKKAMEE